MGVDFAPCTACGRTFPDCGRFAECNEDFGGCGRRYCSDDCAKLASPGRDHPWTWREQEALPQEERDAIKTTCVDCRSENPSDENLLEFLRLQNGLTRDQVVAMYLEANRVFRAKADGGT